MPPRATYFVTAPLDAFSDRAPEHARIFDHLGIAADRGGGRSLAERCLARGLEPATVAAMLEAFDAMMRTAPAVTIELMTLTEICDHIEQTHHARLHDALSRLDILIRTATDRHEAAGSQLPKIHRLFRKFRDGITAHLRAEAGVLFPLIREVEADSSRSSRSRRSLRVAMAEMENDHNEADETLSELHALASAAARPLCEAINRLENELHEQIYKENQVLFPKALALGGRI